MSVADRHHAETRRAAEREAIAEPLAAFNAEEAARLRAVEREQGLGLARCCPGCGLWVSLWKWPDGAALCPVCWQAEEQTEQ